MKIWGKIAIICLVIALIVKNETVATIAASIFWISLIIGLIQKFKNKHKIENSPKQTNLSVSKQQQKKKKIQNVCWKCQHKYMSDGWYNWFMGVCPKCGANNTGGYLIGGVIALILCICAFVPDKKPTETQQQTVQETKELPDYVLNGKLVWEIPVCRRASDYSEYLHAVANKDYKTTRIYEKKHLCFMLKSGVKISVLDWNLIKPTKIRAYKDGNMLDLYTSSVYVKGAD